MTIGSIFGDPSGLGPHGPLCPKIGHRMWPQKTRPRLEVNTTSTPTPGWVVGKLGQDVKIAPTPSHNHVTPQAFSHAHIRRHMLGW